MLALDLPGDFDAYLEQRSHGTAKRFRQILRRLDREGFRFAWAPPGAAPDALAHFVRLHGKRATSRGERHAAVDGRLAHLLARFGACAPEQLRLLELVQGDVRIGVTVRLDIGHTAWFYNGGMDPAAHALSPGIALQLESIRDAIARGVTRYDMGPGDHPYKLKLGAAPTTRAAVTARSPSLKGAAVDTADQLPRVVRRIAPGRRVVRHVRRLRSRP